jgi:hypothetical protein
VISELMTCILASSSLSSVSLRTASCHPSSSLGAETGPYYYYLPQDSRLSTTMTDKPAPVQDVTKFRALVESEGGKLKRGLLDTQGSPSKTHGFDVYKSQPYLKILDPILSHKVGSVAIIQKGNHRGSISLIGTEGETRWRGAT